MKILKTFFFFVLLSFLFGRLFSQDLTQVVRGQVLDTESQAPLAFASVAITTTDPVIGTITDEKGYFRFGAVPVGRHDLKASYVGYEIKLIPELMVNSGKETVLNIFMKESYAELEEVEIKSGRKKDRAINSMATVSARTFSMEEARRYAGGWDDPGRLAASFSGVTTDNIRDNTIIIRGNAPKGLLWRLEGIEIPNPNHFANLTTFGGGGVSALSALVMDNSDFFTGAFPAEYGNATSGVFDIRLRNGNNEKREYVLQLGTLGLDLSSEGPMGKKQRASYLFNYRYSTMGLIKHVFPEEIKDFIPVYQDLSFKINIPTTKAGVFSAWGLASDDYQSFKPEKDSAKWEMADDRMDGYMRQRFAAVGIGHRLVTRGNAYLNTSLALTGDLMKLETTMLDYDLEARDNDFISNRNYKISLTAVYNKKFSARHTNRSGFIADRLHYNTLLRHAPVNGAAMFTIGDEYGATEMLQVFSQSKIEPGRNLSINAGLRAQYFRLNRETVFEPRLGFLYKLPHNQSLGIAYGKHSRLEPLTIYFASVNDGSGSSRPNLDLKISKAHHLVLSYDKRFNQNLRLKVEPYYQYLFDIPGIPDSSFSVLNMDADFYFDSELVNTGTGRNAGIDITLERFLDDGYYYLFTASFFDSKFRGDDGILRDTRYNTAFVFNLLYGKEWVVGSEGNKILGMNVRLNYFGGKRTTPVDQQASAIAQDVVYDYTRLFESREPDKLHMNFTLNYRINKDRRSIIWSFHMVNMLMTKENYGLYYNYRTGDVERFEFAVPVPNISYKIEF